MTAQQSTMRDKALVNGRIAIAYLVFAYLGSLLALLPDSPITMFQPSAGIALAALLLHGYVAIPGIFIGALLTNIALAPETPDAPIPSAGIFITVGLTVGPVIAAVLLKRFAPSAPIWGSARELVLGSLCIGIACLVSTSINVSTITYLGLLPERYPLDAYGMWWLGEFCGMLIFTSIAYLARNHIFPQGPDASHPGDIVTPSLVYASFVGASLASFIILWHIEGDQIKRALNLEASTVATSLSNTLATSGRDLESIRALVSARYPLDEDGFLEYAKVEFGSQNGYTAAQAIGWAPRVTDPRAWEVTMKSRGNPTAFLFETDSSGSRLPAAGREDYFPVELVYPIDDINRSAIGFDLGSESLRREAIEVARATGKLSMIAPIYLVQSEDRLPGMFMCWPIYREGNALPDARGEEVMLGIASGVYFIGTVLDTAIAEFGEDISLHIFESSQPDSEQWFYSRVSSQETRKIGETPLPLKELTDDFHGRAAIKFAGSEWTLIATPGPTYEFLIRTVMPWAILGLVLLLGMGVSAIIIERSYSKRRVDAERRNTENALHEARATNETKSYFMAAASHDIKQPLYALGILTDTLLMTSSDSKTRPIMKNLRKSINSMSQHFDTLMDVGRFQDGSFEAKISVFGLEDLANRIDLEIAPLCRDKGLLWSIEFDDENVRSDPELILRMMRNLLINAVRYTASGEVRCTAKKRGSFIEFEISDTGPGLSPDQQDLVFKEVVQIRANEIHTSVLGLGLSIVNRISHSLNLGLKMNTEPGEGTSFSFRLAAVEQE